MAFYWLAPKLIELAQLSFIIECYICEKRTLTMIEKLTGNWPPDPLNHSLFNTLRPRQDGRHFPDDIFKSIFLNEKVWISINFSLKFVPKGPINNIPALVQIMARRRPGDKPLSEPMMVSLLTHICVTRPQWVNSSSPGAGYMYQWTGSALVHVMACRLFGTKPLPEPMLAYCQLDSWEQVSVKFESKFYQYSFKKMHLKLSSAKWQWFCPGRNELIVVLWKGHYVISSVRQ